MKHRGDFAISVAKDYWNNGIGSQLLNNIIAFAKENNFEIIDFRKEGVPKVMNDLRDCPLSFCKKIENGYHAVLHFYLIIWYNKVCQHLKIIL